MRADFNANAYSSMGKGQGQQVKDTVSTHREKSIPGVFAFLLYLK